MLNIKLKISLNNLNIRPYRIYSNKRPGASTFFLSDFTLNFSDFTLKTPIFNQICLILGAFIRVNTVFFSVLVTLLFKPYFISSWAAVLKSVWHTYNHFINKLIDFITHRIFPVPPDVLVCLEWTDWWNLMADAHNFAFLQTSWQKTTWMQFLNRLWHINLAWDKYICIYNMQ